MQKITLLTASLAVAAAMMSSCAFAADSDQKTLANSSFGITPYIGVRNGISFTDLNISGCDYKDYDYYGYGCTVDDDAVYTVNPYIGISFPIDEFIAISTDIEYFWHSQSDLDFNSWRNGSRVTDKATIDVSGGYINAYATFVPKLMVNPYIGFGLGLAHTKGEIISSVGKFSESRTNFSYHIDGGILLNATEHTAFDLSFRYADYGDVIKNVYRESLDLDDLQILGGVRFNF